MLPSFSAAVKKGNGILGNIRKWTENTAEENMIMLSYKSFVHITLNTECISSHLISKKMVGKEDKENSGDGMIKGK